MTFEEALEKLKIIFSNRGLEISEETTSSFKINRSYLFSAILTEENIESFRQTQLVKEQYANRPFETSITSTEYREQQIQFLHPTKSRFFFLSRNTEILFGTEQSEDIYVKIGKASDLYIWLNIEKDNFWKDSLGRARMRGENTSFAEAIGRPFTIRVYNLRNPSIDHAIKMSSEIIDGCIFTYSSLKDNPIGLLESWPKRTREKNYLSGDIQRSNNFNLPYVKFNPHLIKFYQLAASSDFESHKFLSYYHILEYHFLSVSDQILYDKISRRINDLRFRTNPNNIDRIIQDVNSHRTENDETEMLKNVLIKYLDEEEIISFIKDFEHNISDNLYTKKRTIFGTEINGTNLNTGHVFGTISKHIKIVRNALVHSSDRHERKDRYIPYSVESMEIVKLEIPLLKFIAEKIIIACSETIDTY